MTDQYDHFKRFKNMKSSAVGAVKLYHSIFRCIQISIYIITKQSAQEQTHPVVDLRSFTRESHGL